MSNRPWRACVLSVIGMWMLIYMRNIFFFSLKVFKTNDQISTAVVHINTSSTSFLPSSFNNNRGGGCGNNDAQQIDFVRYVCDVMAMTNHSSHMSEKEDDTTKALTAFLLARERFWCRILASKKYKGKSQEYNQCTIGSYDIIKNEEAASSLKAFYVTNLSIAKMESHVDSKDSKRSKKNKKKKGNDMPAVLNSIRIPKAGSSALSVTARALAGCQPDGYPCCKFGIGVPKDSCPRHGLFCPQITGCKGHLPDYEGSEPIISAFRRPVDRHLSGFFQSGVHTSVKPGQPRTWEAFDEYTQNPNFQNIITKMLAGSFPYIPYNTSLHTVSTAKSRICQMEWFSLDVMPLASSLLLYEADSFQNMIPNPVVFGLPSVASVLDPPSLTDDDNDNGLRVNNKSEYIEFKKGAFVKRNGTQLFEENNQQDLEVYQFAKEVFCARLILKIPLLVTHMQHYHLGLQEIAECQAVLEKTQERWGKDHNTEHKTSVGGNQDNVLTWLCG